MARKPRIYSDSQIYHIILRGNNQQNLFYEDKDRYFLLNRISKYANETGIEIYGYCLMDNHVHILLGKANPVLSLFVQKLTNSYVYYFNHKYERSGHLFQGRFKSEPVNDDIYFKTVLRYILQNPCKNRKNFKSYSWNSYKELFSCEKNKIITREYVLNLFDNPNDAVNFINLNEPCDCMEYENKPFISDERAYVLMKKIFGTKKVDNIIKTDLKTLFPKISKLKKIGLSINQISRLTNIPKKLIRSA